MLLVNFIGSLGFSIVFPFLVFLVERYGGNAIIYGCLGATYPAFQMIGAPILGRWSDVYGRKKILLLSQAGTLLSWCIFAAALVVPTIVLLQVDGGWTGGFAFTLPLLILFTARALDGLTGGNISVANAYVADITPEEGRARAFGKMGIAANLGFIVGPAVAGVLGGTRYGEAVPVALALLISAIATWAVAFLVRESNPCVLESAPRNTSVRRVLGQGHKDCTSDAAASTRGLLRRGPILYMLALYFLMFLAFNFFYTAFPVHAVRGLEWSVGKVGIYFTILGGVMVVVQGPVLTWLTRRVSNGWLIMAGNVLLGFSFACLTEGPGLLVWMSAILFAVGNGIMWPSYLGVLSRVAGDRDQGAVQGLAGSVGSLASIVGLILGGILYSWVGASTFWISAGLIAVAGVLSLRILRLERRAQT